VTSSADGGRLLATGFSDQLHVSIADQSSVGIAGSLAGSQFDALSLQYLGNGVFMPVSQVCASGAFVVN
jgi:hypothetical protein